MQELTPENVSVLKNSNKPIVLKFYAEWCGPCRTYAPIVEMVAGNLPQVTFYGVDMGKFPSLAETLGVTSIPATIVFENGKEVSRALGILNAKQIVGMLQNTLTVFNS